MLTVALIVEPDAVAPQAITAAEHGLSLAGAGGGMIPAQVQFA